MEKQILFHSGNIITRRLLYGIVGCFVEVYYMAADNTYTKIEGFEQNDKRLNIYIDYMNKTKDYPFEND